MHKQQFSLFLTTLIIIGFFFVVLAENVIAGITPPPACSILIEKIEIPDTGEDFDFQLTGTANENFSLANNDSKVLEFQEAQAGVLTENIPPDYNLDIECTEGEENCSDNGGFETCLSITPLEDGNGVTIQCDDSATNDTGSCTFTNILIPAAEVAQVPTLSKWGFIAMVVLLGIIGFIVIRKRKLTTKS